MILNYILTILAPLLGGGNALISSRLQSNSFFSKDYTNVLKGLCCIIVIYVHINASYGNPLQDAIGSFAYVCVTLFFLISAYGMMLSAEKKKDYLSHFWRNRLVALLIPCLLINIVDYAFNVTKGTAQWNMLYHINAYVQVLLQFCVWFYIVEVCKKHWFADRHKLSDGLLIAGVVISSILLYVFVHGEFSSQSGWCFERMGLVWGILLYRYYPRIVGWMDKHRLVKTIVLCIVSAVLGVAYLKYKTMWLWGEYLLKIVLGLAIIMFLFTATSNRAFGNKIAHWLGDISYEVYLSHGFIMGVLAYFCAGIESGVFILSTVVLTLGFSTVIHRIGKPIVRMLRK